MQRPPPHGRAPGSFSPMPGSSSIHHAASLSSMAAAAAASAPSPPRPPVPPKRPATSDGESTTPLPISKTRSHGDSLSSAGSFGGLGSGSRSGSFGGGSRTPTPIYAQFASGSSSVYRPSSRGETVTTTRGELPISPPLPPLPTSSGGGPPSIAITASQIAAQAAAARDRQQQQSRHLPHQQHRQHQDQHQHQHQHQQFHPYMHPYLASHARQRSQTVPGEGSRPSSPPVLSLTEASGPSQDGGFIPYHNGLPGNHKSAATAAANVVFPRVGTSQASSSPSPTAPSHPQTTSTPSAPPQLQSQSQPPPPPVEEKAEKSRLKLFGKGRPPKISKGDTKEKPLPSPGMTTAKSSLLSALHRGNQSTFSLAEAPGSMYSLNNSSTATIRPYDADGGKEKEKEKEKKHNFLSRTKHKHSKEEFHLPLSSAASNSRPTDPNAPSSLYNFSAQPSSPAPTSSSFPKGIHVHGGRRDKKAAADRGDDGAGSERLLASNMPHSMTTLSAQSNLLYETFDPTKYGLTNMSADDAWPWLKAKLQAVFEGEDLRIPVEDMNRVVALHLQYCLKRRALNTVLDDLGSLLDLGFSSMDHMLQQVPEDRLIPILVEYWIFAFTSILPSLQAIFLPLDLEFSGTEHARDYLARKASISSQDTIADRPSTAPPHPSPYAGVDIVRRLILTAFRDRVVLPRYESLKTIFSRLSLEFLPASLTSNALASPPLVQDSSFPQQGSSPAESFLNNVTHPATPLSTSAADPLLGSFNSTATTLNNNDSRSSSVGVNTTGSNGGGRSRAISNVSFSSASLSDGGFRPFTPSSLRIVGEASSSGSTTATLGMGIGMSNIPGGGSHHHHRGGATREQNIAEDSKQVTDMVGRMLQCMSVLGSLGVLGEVADERHRKVDELCKLLKLNWLGRGRTGRNRRGMVGGRVRRDREEGITAS